VDFPEGVGVLPLEGGLYLLSQYKIYSGFFVSQIYIFIGIILKSPLWF